MCASTVTHSGWNADDFGTYQLLGFVCRRHRRCRQPLSVRPRAPPPPLPYNGALARVAIVVVRSMRRWPAQIEETRKINDHHSVSRPLYACLSIYEQAYGLYVLAESYISIYVCISPSPLCVYICEPWCYIPYSPIYGAAHSRTHWRNDSGRRRHKEINLSAPLLWLGLIVYITSGITGSPTW